MSSIYPSLTIVNISNNFEYIKYFFLIVAQNM